MRARRALVVGIAVLALAGCGGAAEDEPPAGGTDAEVGETTEPQDGGDDSLEPTEDATAGTGDAADDSGGAVTLDVQETSLGEVVVDGEGMTLYMFDPDEQGESTCYDDCATAWPPLVVDEPSVSEALDDSMVGTVERTDGTLQVTYNDWPLYYWQNDSEPGDVSGQAVNDVWWVVGPDGEPIRTAPTASPTS